MARYIVTISRGDHGSQTRCFSSLHAAWACASTVTFAAGGLDDMLAANNAFREFRRRTAKPVRMTWEPSNRTYAITILRHD